MSPILATLGMCARCFPRVSGDEPADDLANMPLGVFSPRERG